MITGSVNSALEATLRLAAHDPTGQAHEFEAVIDTGFNGFLTLPPALIAALGLPWLCRQDGQLADGSVVARVCSGSERAARSRATAIE